MPSRAFIDSDLLCDNEHCHPFEFVLMPSRAFIDSDADEGLAAGWGMGRLNALTGIY